MEPKKVVGVFCIFLLVALSLIDKGLLALVVPFSRDPEIAKAVFQVAMAVIVAALGGVAVMLLVFDIKKKE